MVDRFNNNPDGTNGPDSHNGPSHDDDQIIQDVKETYRDVADIDAVQARARAKFMADAESAPVYMSARRRKSWRHGATIAGVVALASAVGAVYVLVNPGTGKDSSTINVATPTITQTEVPTPAGTGPSATDDTSTTDPTPDSSETDTTSSPTATDDQVPTKTTKPNTQRGPTEGPGEGSTKPVQKPTKTVKKPDSPKQPGETDRPGEIDGPGTPDKPGKPGKPAQQNYLKLTKNGEFLTPDKTVMCVVYENGQILCAAKTVKYKPGPKPKRCGTDDYGASISSSPTRKARLECGSDYLYADAGPALKVGTTLTGPQGLTCKTTSTSVTCHYGAGKNRFTYSEKAFRLS